MQVLGPISEGWWWHHHWTCLSYHKWHCSNLFFWKGKGQIPFFKAHHPSTEKSRALVGFEPRTPWARHWRVSLYQYTTATSTNRTDWPSTAWSVQCQELAIVAYTNLTSEKWFCLHFDTIGEESAKTITFIAMHYIIRGQRSVRIAPPPLSPHQCGPATGQL